VIEPVLSDDAFIADVLAARGHEVVGKPFALWWLGQSGFLLHWRNSFALLDPYLSDSLTVKYAATDKPHVRMTRRVIAPERLAHLPGLAFVASSHNHTDHLDADTLKPILRPIRGINLVAPRANVEFAAKRLGVPPDWVAAIDDGETISPGGPFTVSAVPAAHETVEHDEQGRCRFLGYVVRCRDGPTVYHAGDTVRYDGMVETLGPLNIDIALLPINGRAPERRVAGNLNGPEAARLAKDIRAKLVIPCHYEMFAFNTATPDEFVAECGRLGQPYRVLRAGERYTARR
jgi:L-ascorbate metabolism protein UlaG (beta-lactamase superfamily)